MTRPARTVWRTCLAVALIAGVSPAMAQIEEEPVVLVTDPFSLADTNKDGAITLDEYRVHVDKQAEDGDRVSLNIKNNEAYEGMFNAYDRDKDRKLMRAEFIAATNIGRDVQ